MGSTNRTRWRKKKKKHRLGRVEKGVNLGRVREVNMIKYVV